ncbi:hypothetical protein KP509_31G015900 [Ceratopteris richardii]|nr:hypothetical protein KP509_31G015900 [Ceratopteris richardii]
MLGVETDDDELIAMIDRADWNSDGFLDFPEFAAFYYSFNEDMGHRIDPSNNSSCDVGIEQVEDDSDLRDAFTLFDKNGDGYICAEELQSVLSNMGLSHGSISSCRDMIRSVDIDGDGQVSFEEFKRMMSTGFVHN